MKISGIGRREVIVNEALTNNRRLSESRELFLEKPNLEIITLRNNDFRMARLFGSVESTLADVCGTFCVANCGVRCTCEAGPQCNQNN